MQTREPGAPSADRAHALRPHDRVPEVRYVLADPSSPPGPASDCRDREGAEPVRATRQSCHGVQRQTCGQASARSGSIGLVTAPPASRWPPWAGPRTSQAPGEPRSTRRRRRRAGWPPAHDPRVARRSCARWPVRRRRLLRFAQRRGSQGTRLVLLVALAEFADQDHICRPAIGTLSERCGVGRSSLFEHIRGLEADGYVGRAPEHGMIGMSRTRSSATATSPDATGSSSRAPRRAAGGVRSVVMRPTAAGPMRGRRGSCRRGPRLRPWRRRGRGTSRRRRARCPAAWRSCRCPTRRGRGAARCARAT